MLGLRAWVGIEWEFSRDENGRAWVARNGDDAWRTAVSYEDGDEAQQHVDGQRTSL